MSARSRVASASREGDSDCSAGDHPAGASADRPLLDDIAACRLLFENSLDAIFVHDETGRFVDVNAEACARLGYSRQELLGMSLADLDAPEDAEPTHERLRQIRQGKGARFETRHTTKSGLVIPVEVTCHAFHMEGRVLFFSMARDITERKRMEQVLEQGRLDLEKRVAERTAALTQANKLLRQAEQQKQIILDSVDECVAFFDHDFNCLWANRAFREKAPREVEALAGGRKCHSAFFGLDEQCGECPISRCAQAIRREKARKTLPDGQVWEVQCFPARDDLGQTSGTVYIARDVSDEENLRRRTLLVQKMESIGVMAGGIAHEFNNILAIIIGYTELCLEATTPGERLYSHLKEIFKASGRARDVVRQMLTFSRGDDTPKTPLKIIPVVKETIRFLRASLTETVIFELDLPLDTPLVNANPTQIQQALLNLCKNAADAMPGGGVIAVRVFTQDPPAWPEDPAGAPPGPFVVLSVRDSGEGISPLHMENIFDPFFSTKPAGVGTGLGLSVVHGIVTGMGGHILVESKEGRGSTFTLYLPIHKERVPPPQDKPTTVASADQPPKGRRILHVDDSALILHLAKLTLNRLGYETVSCSDPGQALELFLADPHAFDLAILDQAMPGMPGMELLRLMKDARPDMPFLLCTGYSETCLQLQTDQPLPHVLMKPFKKADLAKAVQAALEPPAA